MWAWLYPKRSTEAWTSCYSLINRSQSVKVFIVEPRTYLETSGLNLFTANWGKWCKNANWLSQTDNQQQKSICLKINYITHFTNTWMNANLHIKNCRKNKQKRHFVDCWSIKCWKHGLQSISDIPFKSQHFYIKTIISMFSVG